MTQPLDFSGFRPCSQKWSDMTPAEKGRNCLSCQKFVHDFRGHSDFEIGRAHILSDVPICGMYDAWRVNGEKTETAREPSLSSNRWLKWAGMVAVLLGSPIEMHGHGQEMIPLDSPIVNVDSLPVKVEASFAVSPTDHQNLRIEGRLVLADPDTFLVHLVGTEIVLPLDTLGRFQIEIPDSAAQWNQWTLKFQSFGDQSWSVEILPEEFSRSGLYVLDVAAPAPVKQTILGCQTISTPRRSFFYRAWRRISSVFRKK
ncbi:hypothetical protein [Pontibacter sp. G13]|uniref:hypothetical protein n=1 Tax=Pontibacter sp. G13 TaxID=3074898 RepID=UPI0028890B06|nr:hypothetical protein [Pontibacter sp. G13]WNJ18796.1 hypothetical protein RJD25_28400 [Pontibacter sp. G13]